MKLAMEIADWIKKQVKDAGKKGIVLGLSGGVDSAVVGALSKRAMGDDLLGLILSCKSQSGDEQYALKIAEKFNIKIEKISLDDIYDMIILKYPRASDMAKANIKPRLRMIALYYFANSLNYLVAGTGNKSEIAVGYFTKYGDGGVDILPIAGLFKTEVRQLAKELGIPQEIIDRVPSAGLWVGQTDEGEMGITYEELDKTLIAIENNKTKNIDKGMLKKVKKMIVDSEHKRASIPIFKVKSKKAKGKSIPQSGIS